MECSRCGDKDQNESFCTNCGASMSEIKSPDSIANSGKKRKRGLAITLSIAALLLVIAVIGFFARSSVISSIKGLYEYGEYRSVLANCPGSGIDIYWAPIHVENSQGQNLSQGAIVTYERINYLIDIDNAGDGHAFFTISHNGLGTKDLLGCGG